MTVNWRLTTRFLEEGNIYFFYKPKKGRKDVGGLTDVSRFYFVLDPYGGKSLRFVVMGPKRMPALMYNDDRAWGFVEKVGGRGFATTSLRKQTITGKARPAGEGLYALVKHADHTHLVYTLELPERVGPVQKTFNITREGSLIIVVKHPEIDIPATERKREIVGRGEVVRYSDELTSRFGSRRYVPLDPPGYLDYEGTMLYLIAVGESIARLGIEVSKEKETEDTADIFRELRLNRDRHPTEPLFKGTWK